MNIGQERAEFEVWRRKHYDYDDLTAFEIEFAFAAFQAGRAALQSQDKEDAERYRWLRNRASPEGICVVHIDYWSEEYRGQAHCEVYDGEFLDKAIDHARRAREGG